MNKELYRWENEVDIINLEKVDCEFSGKDSDDLMYVRGFATHEGVNANGTKFRREILQKTYNSLIDKPLRILTDFYNNPTGHGFNKKTKTFSKNIINIGHIIKVTPVIVGADEQILCEVNSLTDELPEGNYRLLFDAVLYKEYYNEIAEVLVDLHNSKQLKFSIESNISYELSENNIKDCTDIKFIGLSIVKNPAFEKAFSILVAEEERKELDDLDYEKLYNEIKEQFDVLVAEKETLIAEKITLETASQELVVVKENLEAEMVIKNTQITDLSVEVAELNTFKTKFETSEKEKVGNERLATLKELGETELTSQELSEMDELAFSNTQVEMAKKLLENVGKLNSVNFQTKLNRKNSSETLREALGL